jgi:hypothetical protein
LYPEFKGAVLNEHPDGELRWLIRASCRGKKGNLSAPRIKFELAENTWADGLVRAMQEMQARVCGLHVEEVQGGRFRDFARRDADGRPANMPGQNAPSTYIDHMDFNSIITPIFIGSQQTQHVELHNGSLVHVKQLTRPKHEAHGGEDNHLATTMDP